MMNPGMLPKRVVAFVDGFNLYHAIDDLGKHHLKWLDLRLLCEIFAPSPRFALTEVYYFSAFATWLPATYARHRQYVTALRTSGVTPIMGNFKEKDRQCKKCGDKWKQHEEKETDVNIALYLYQAAVANKYDRALLISGDSDLVPAVRLVRGEFPSKEIRIIAPVRRHNSAELLRAAGGQSTGKKLSLLHIERCIFPQQVLDSDGKIVATRPTKYDPP